MDTKQREAIREATSKMLFDLGVFTSIKKDLDEFMVSIENILKETND